MPSDAKGEMAPSASMLCLASARLRCAAAPTPCADYPRKLTTRGHHSLVYEAVVVLYAFPVLHLASLIVEGILGLGGLAGSIFIATDPSFIFVTSATETVTRPFVTMIFSSTWTYGQVFRGSRKQEFECRHCRLHLAAVAAAAAVAAVAAVRQPVWSANFMRWYLARCLEFALRTVEEDKLRDDHQS